MTGGGLGPAAAEPGRALLRIRGLDGALRGLGFVADPQGTVLTAHEVVAGLDRVVLHTEDGQSRLLGPDDMLLLPAQGLALLRTGAAGALPVPPLPIAAPAPGRPVAVPRTAGNDQRITLLQGGIAAGTAAMYAWAGEFHVIGGALVLDLPQLLGAPPAGAPVLDAASGAVLGVVAPGLRSPYPAGTHPVGALAAVPGDGDPDLARLLARNAAGVPGYGRALNLAGVLRLAAVRLASADAGPAAVADLAADRVERPDGLVGEEPRATVTALLGAPGSGRSTELAALAARRASGLRALPTLWLRGADLYRDGPGAAPLAEAVGRALADATRLLAGDRPGAGPGPDPGEAAALCSAAHRPLLVVLDSPEEAPAALDTAWLRAATRWLDGCGARLLTACGPDAWEQLAHPAPGADDGADPAERPRVHRLGPLPAETADRARRHHGLPAGRPAAADARHPLALRLAGQLWAAGVHGEPGSRGELFAGHLDLRCLAVARRLAGTAPPRRPGAHRRGGPRPAGEDHGRLRRLAAAVAGRVHEAARRMLGPGHGSLARTDFDELFPQAGGWAAAALAERLFVPAGPGYRPAHEEFSDWLQGLHLDLDEALRLLLDEDGAGAREPAVARHRAGPVLAALRALADTWGPTALDPWLHRLLRALDTLPAGSEPAWWAGRLLAGVLAADPAAAGRRDLLAQLADRGAERAPDRFGPAFWAALGLPPEHELDLLRRLVRTDGPEQRFLAATARRLRADPATVVPLLCGWLGDPRGLPARPGSTVADLAHDLLHSHRDLALDDLTDRLADTAHPRADALLAVLAADEPSALCRAVDRWSHDPRPERHVAAAVHALRAAPHARGSGPELLRHSALALLAREDEPALHGAALALLVHAPQTRAGHLPRALAAYGRGDPFVTAAALGPALESHPEPVLAALTARLAAPGAAVAEGLRALAAAASPAARRGAAELAARLLRERPELAGQVAAEYLGRRLRCLPGPAGAPAELRALLDAVLALRPAGRRVFAELLAAPGGQAAPGGGARAELLAALVAAESDPAVLTAVLECLAEGCERRDPARTRELVALAGAALLEADEVLLRCAGRSAAFALLLAQWPDEYAPPLPEGPGLARLRALTAAGRDPQYAAAQAQRGLSRPGQPAQPRTTGLPVPKQGRAHGTL
ncbi:serine protease [Kitasatospora sp. NPDC057223]|uniref:serine protease n=1 Tax=Kitasatospora sp. NPDC057223 TaxID=3346055 RepID=UPI00363FD1DA